MRIIITTAQQQYPSRVVAEGMKTSHFHHDHIQRAVDSTGAKGIRNTLEHLTEEGLRECFSYNQGGFMVWVGLFPSLPLLPYFDRKAVKKSKDAGRIT